MTKHSIIISAGQAEVRADLYDTPTGRAILDALPVEAKASLWGDEIYFEIPVRMDLEPDAREDVEIGEMGYWPVGRAFCIFFGPTPSSTGSAPMAASAVNIIGRVNGDASVFRRVRSGEKVRIRIDQS
jgi:hypothetical protein